MDFRADKVNLRFRDTNKIKTRKTKKNIYHNIQSCIHDLPVLNKFHTLITESRESTQATTKSGKQKQFEIIALKSLVFIK